MSNQEPLKLFLLPPAPDVCPQCAVDHQANEPHNQDSLFWKLWFYHRYGRWPTWKDAAANCDPEAQETIKETIEAAGAVWE